MPDVGSVCRLLEAIASAPYRAGTSAGRGEIRRHERVRDCSAHPFNRSIKALFRLSPGALDQAATEMDDRNSLKIPIAAGPLLQVAADEVAPVVP